MRYSVTLLIPIGTIVEADNFEEAIDKAFEEIEYSSYYGGDGIFAENLDTGEEYEE